MVGLKRIYDQRSSGDGVRILVDRLWPRGIRRADAHIELWMRDIAPSNELRQFFAHDPARWEEFRKRYLAELESPAAASMLAQLLEVARAKTLTLVYSAKDREHNQAVVLKQLIDKKLQAHTR